MAKDDFFTFGDEDLEDTGALWKSSGELDGAGSLAVADAAPPYEDDRRLGRVAKGAQRSRGGSGTRSSENREPPSLRVQTVVALSVVVAGAVFLKVVLGAISGGGSAQPEVKHSASVQPHVQALQSVKKPATRARASRERAAQRERAQQRRALTRRRARRSRERRESDRPHRSAGNLIGGAEPRRPPASQTSPESAESAPVEPIPNESPPPSEPATAAPTPQQSAQAQFGIESASTSTSQQGAGS